MLKRTTIVLLFLTVSTIWAYAQFGVQVSYLKPSGMLGFVFKPTVNVEIIYGTNDIEDKFKIRATLGYYRLNTRQDTFTTYSYSSFGSTTVYPGMEVFKNYSSITIGSGIEYRILDKPLSPEIGIDANLYFVNYKYILHSYGLFLDENKSQKGFGIIPRIGASYMLNKKLLLSFSFGRSLYYLMEDKAQAYWKIASTLSYYL